MTIEETIKLSDQELRALTTQVIIEMVTRGHVYEITTIVAEAMRAVTTINVPTNIP